ncbi:MAG: response regulator [Candidatus Berkelbacteria bacterium]
MPKGSKVLMADDDKMLLDMYKERLELAGYVVNSNGNGEEALASVRDFQPDIIMLDVMMPKLNGYETLASLKSDPATKDIPVVMLSALMRDFNREKAVEGGAEDYLIKSEAMPSDVITKIEQVLQKYGKGSTPVPGAPAAPAQAVSAEPAKPEVVFEPAAADTSSASVGAAPVAAQAAIETQPEVTMPKAQAAPAPQVEPATDIVPTKKDGSTGLVVTLSVLVLIIIIGATYFLFVKK